MNLVLLEERHGESGVDGWRRTGCRGAARSIIGAPARPGKPFSGKLRVLKRVKRLDNALNRSCYRVMTLQGAAMDLAMAMGIALFGMFTGSTVLFFYQLGR
ncbi:hypothetical protein [Burkholderia stagnalis]|uniref:hypothetical protein n=1 Tax=Burkholderia stagnalis TaxID=1503054 RepID=UPI000F57ABD6|nr:hypothetical protein [Burkholderia stagnalis]